MAIALPVDREAMASKEIHRTEQHSSELMEDCLLQGTAEKACCTSPVVKCPTVVKYLDGRWNTVKTSVTMAYGTHVPPLPVDGLASLGLVIQRARTCCKTLDPELNNKIRVTDWDQYPKVPY